jgi:hypothetical protein
LGEHLIKCGHLLVLVPAAAVKNNRSLLDGRWDKHDTKDSANVADLISQGECLYYEYPDTKVRDIRNLLSLKRRLKKEEHGLRVRSSLRFISGCAHRFPQQQGFHDVLHQEGVCPPNGLKRELIDSLGNFAEGFFLLTGSTIGCPLGFSPQ